MPFPPSPFPPSIPPAARLYPSLLVGSTFPNNRYSFDDLYFHFTNFLMRKQQSPVIPVLHRFDSKYDKRSCRGIRLKRILRHDRTKIDKNYTHLVVSRANTFFLRLHPSLCVPSPLRLFHPYVFAVTFRFPPPIKSARGSFALLTTRSFKRVLIPSA